MGITSQFTAKDMPAAKAAILNTFDTLPAMVQVEVLRQASDRFSWSYGFDQIDAGLDRISGELRDEAERGRVAA